MKKLDNIVLSTDDSHFKQFAPIVYSAWKKILPDSSVILSYVAKDTNRETNKDILKFEKIFDKVFVFNEIESIPSANLAKMARRYVCLMLEDQVSMIEDIDTAPLNKQYILNIISKREVNHLGMVGREVYEGTPHEGKVPASYTFAEQKTWQKAMNPDDLSFVEWCKSFVGLKVFDHKEDISASPTVFSDESLMRALLYKNNFNEISHIERNIDPKTDWIDRSWWNIDAEKLARNEYICVNFMRPIDLRAKELVKHIMSDMRFD